MPIMHRLACLSLRDDLIFFIYLPPVSKVQIKLRLTTVASMSMGNVYNQLKRCCPRPLGRKKRRPQQPMLEREEAQGISKL